MKKYKLLVALMLLIALIGKSVISLGVTQADVDAEKKKADQLKTEAEQKKKEQTNIKSDKAVATTDLNTINSQIDSLQSEIDALGENLDELNSEIKTKENEIKEKEKEYKEKEAILKKRLVAIYKNGGTSYLDVLFSSANYVDMLSSYDVVEKIAESDNKLMDEIQKTKESLENNKKELENKKSDVEKTKKQKDEKNAQLIVAKKQKQTEVDKLSDKEKATQTEIDNKQKAIQQAEQSMASIFKKLQAQLAAQKAAEEARKKAAASKPSSSDSSKGSSSTGLAGLNFDGTFQWPTTTKLVTSRMKFRWGRMHKGIDIGVAYQPVYAAASGIAYNAYNPGGYGTYVMLFHGNGYVTLYGHLSTSKVADGQTVSKGQVIAISGNSGGSTGPHLHFEIRRAESAADFFSKSPLDPLQYLPGGYTLNE